MRIAAGMVLGLLLMASMAGGMEFSIAERDNMSVKAGPTAPGEGISLAWLESFVYPKVAEGGKKLSLGVRTTSKVKGVSAAFDFSDKKVPLSSSDGMNWNGICKIPADMPSGMHLVRYEIDGVQGSVKRSIAFFVMTGPAGDGALEVEKISARNWPLTVTSTCPVLVGNSARILTTGEKVVGLLKEPWYKIVLGDGQEAWVSAGVVKEPFDEFCAKGFDAYSEGKYTQAIEYYKGTLSMDPSSEKGHFWLAKCYSRLGNNDAAARSIKEAMRLNEGNMECKAFANTLAQDFFRTAHLKYTSGRFNEAILSYQKVLDLKPTSFISWLEMGKSYDRLGFSQEARDSWREAIRLDAENKEVLSLLGMDAASVKILSPSDEPGVSSSGVKPRVLDLVSLQQPVKDVSPVLADDSIQIVRGGRTNKGTSIDAALRSVISLTKSLGTPVVEKGWEIKKRGKDFMVRFLCEQGQGALEAFEWRVDIDTKQISASNDNARTLMSRW